MSEDLERIRSRLSGLHFAQDAMRPHERETLHLAEDLLARIDALRDLCDEAVEQQEIDPPMVLVQEVRSLLDGGDIWMEDKGSRTHEGVTGTVYGPAGREFPWREPEDPNDDPALIEGRADFVEAHPEMYQGPTGEALAASRLRRAGRSPGGER